MPFIVWTSAAYRREFALVAQALAANSGKLMSPSASVFHTMLGLAGITSPVRNDSLSVASTLFAVRPCLGHGNGNLACADIQSCNR